MGRLRKFIFIPILLLALLSIIAALLYHYAVLEPIGRRYAADMRVAATRLLPHYDRLARSTEEKFFSDPNLQGKDYNGQADRYRSEITGAEKELSRFEQVSDNFTLLPYAPVPSAYTTGVTKFKARKVTIGSMREAMKDYRQLIDYLEKYYAITSIMEDRLNSFNSLQDINVLSGDGSLQLLQAAEIEAAAVDLEALRPPERLKTFHSQTVETHRLASEGFRNLASGLADPIDANIYAAVGQIETASSKHEGTDTELLVKLLETSPILQRISDLPEKLEQYR